MSNAEIFEGGMAFQMDLLNLNLSIAREARESNVQTPARERYELALAEMRVLTQRK